MAYTLEMLDPDALSETDARFDCTSTGMAMIRAALSICGVLVRGSVKIDPTTEPAYRIGPGVIAVQKFSTNDGWVVIPDECVTAARALHALLTERTQLDAWLADGPPRTEPWDTPDNNRMFLAEFARFCAHASKHGGFSVH
jgi:hypothetical protein